MATKAALLSQGFERVSERIANWYEAREQAHQYWQQGRAAMLIKEAGGWAIYALPIPTNYQLPQAQTRPGGQRGTV